MKALKFIGIGAGAFVGLLILLFFLYPYIQSDKAGEVQTRQVDEELLIRGDRLPNGVTTSGVFENLKAELDTLGRERELLLARVDSLMDANEQLAAERDELEQRSAEAAAALEKAESRQESVSLAGGTSVMGDEAFSERVKSLLNLDEEELAEIVKHMDDDQLILLYRNSGNMQREKLLRSLAPPRAAKLMRTVMS